MDLQLKGHNVLITGGTKGIGRAIAETLSDEGCNIALCARNADDVAAAQASISAKGVKVVAEALDVADADAFTAWIAQAGETLGGIDAFVSNVSGSNGKGLSGGRVIIYPPKNSTFIPQNEIIAGNVCGYGATGGEMYLSGCVAERFCVRNSGAIAVVEGVGDHGCEYMTGGRAVILGEVGRNFGAGMSGGIAFVYNPNLTLQSRANQTMIDFDSMDDNSQKELFKLLTNHAQLTGSRVAHEILDNWNKELANFVKVMPKALKSVLEAQNNKLLQAS